MTEASIAAVYAAEGLLNAEHRILLSLLRSAVKDPDKAPWKEIGESRIRVFNYTKQYTQAIMRIENS